MNLEKLARFLSLFLGPPVWFSILIVAALFKSGISNQNLNILLGSLFILLIIIPIGYIYVAVTMGKVTAWDLPKRQERYKFLVLIGINSLISIILIYFLGNQFLFNLGLILILLLLIISLITLFWKISFHSSMGVTGVILLNFLFGWKLYFLYLAILLIFWSRLKLKRHNLYQLSAGVLVSGFIILVSLIYLGYL